jgi:putative hydrolase of the HAD superfamily
MFKVILFDADGMVIVSKRFSDQLQADYGITWDKMKPFFNGPFQRCKLGQADLKEELAKAMIDWGWRGTVDELIDLWFRSGSTTDARMADLIHDLRAKGVRCYLTSNQERHRAEYLRTQMRFDTLFDGLFISAEIGCMKNDPRFFEHVLQALRVADPSLQPSEILFADDHQENINIARSCGIETHLYKHFEDFSTLTT